MPRVTISLPEELLRRIDDEARRLRTTRSAFLRQAALRELGRLDPLLDAAALIRNERDARHRRLGVLDLRGRVHWEGDLTTAVAAAREG